MIIIDTNLPEVKIIEPRVFGDERGFFLETYNAPKYLQAGIDAVFVQDNHSRSSHGTLRGLHYQLQHPQGKLCRVTRGRVWDVAVDIRVGSPNFGKWVGALLSEENQRQIWVPRGFAHGFIVLSESADFLYKCDDVYTPGDEFGVRFDDENIGVQWPLNEMRGDLVLSEKDRVAPNLAQIAPEDLPQF